MVPGPGSSGGDICKAGSFFSETLAFWNVGGVGRKMRRRGQRLALCKGAAALCSISLKSQKSVYNK